MEPIRSEEKISMLGKVIPSQPKILTISVNNNGATNARREKLEQTSKDSLLLSEPVKAQDGYSSKKGVINQCLMTGSVFLLAMACGMPIGYSAVLLPQLYVRNDSMQIDADMGSWIASIHSAATPVGSLMSGSLMDRFGRRSALQLAVLPLMAGWVLLATAPSHAVVLVGRVVSGIAVGLIGAPSQVILGEISEPKLRGILIGAPFVSYSMGILLVYALGACLGWREVAALGTILPFVGLIATCFFPESPVWLVKMGRIDKATKALEFLRADATMAKREVQQLESRIQMEMIGSTMVTNEKNSFWRMIFRPYVLKPLLIINVFNILQVVSGTYIVVFYAVDIISELGGEGLDNMMAAVVTAIVRLVCTFIFCFLLLLISRRRLALGSGVGSAVSSLTLGVFIYARAGMEKNSLDMFFPAVCILLYVACNTGFMVLPGIMLGELLPAKIRGIVAGYIFCFFNIVLFGAAKVFPVVRYTIGSHGLFILFGTASLVATFFLYMFYPESKGKTLAEIEDHFRNESIIWGRRNKTTKYSEKSTYCDA